MSSKVWIATGEYTKLKRRFTFTKELMGDKEDHVKESIFSELGSRHRVKRRYITFTEIKEIKPEDVQNLELRKALGLESEM
ncbi:MAG: 50S ribosomal protein L18Ae [Candidatus Thorarchaeota archaeon]|nr:50S ribosomal protein L18Ae [Candidatus Thorarchaeota archaeon]